MSLSRLYVARFLLSLSFMQNSFNWILFGLFYVFLISNVVTGCVQEHGAKFLRANAKSSAGVLRSAQTSSRAYKVQCARNSTMRRQRSKG